MPRFEIIREPLDVTRNGMFGGPADTERQFVPGLAEYRIDGRRVSVEEFERRLRQDDEARKASR